MAARNATTNDSSHHLSSSGSAISCTMIYRAQNVEGKMPHDSQRSRMFEAENSAGLESARLETVAEMQIFVDRITESRWWKTRTRKKFIKVMPGRGCRNALATYSRWGLPIIKMPKWSRSEYVILHELAHHLTPSEYAAHGKEFCKNHLAMIKRWLGHEQWKRLHNAFHNFNVKHHKRPEKILAA